MTLVLEESTEDRLRELYPGRVGTTLIRLRARDKRPIDAGWNAQAEENFTNQIDPGPIYASIAEHVDAGGNVGWAIPTGVLVLDADNETSAAWVAEAFPDAPRQRTRKGCHVVVKEPAGVDLRQTTQLEIVDGITVDLRSAGKGQIAVEPSIHPSGFAYSWEIELPLDLDTLPDIPDAIVERMRTTQKQHSENVHDINEAVWREGSRESRLISMAGRLRNMSFAEPEILGALSALNATRCVPPLDRRDLERMARSAGKWDRGEDPTQNDDSEHGKRVASKIMEIAFTGDRLRALADREPIPTLYPGIPARGHLNLLIGAPFAGKSTSALWIAMARAAGCAPWIGAPEIEPGSTLIVSPDQSVEQVARVILRLSRKHPGGRTFDYFEKITVIGLDSTVDPMLVQGLRFDEQGFNVTDEVAGSFDAIIFDAYADMLPEGVSEDSNEDASLIGGRLEAIAVKHDIPITLIHHIGKMRDKTTAEVDVRDLARGASALAAKARAISTFEEVGDFTNQRRIRSRTNLTKTPAPLSIEVAERSTGEASIDFLRPLDPATTYPIEDLLPDPEEWVSTSELARRLSDQPEGKPGGQAISLAREVRGIWLGAGMVETRQGKRNATEIRRVK